MQEGASAGKLIEAWSSPCLCLFSSTSFALIGIKPDVRRFAHSDELLSQGKSDCKIRATRTASRFDRSLELSLLAFANSLARRRPATGSGDAFAGRLRFICAWIMSVRTKSGQGVLKACEVGAFLKIQCLLV